ncbi:hypothetical protein PINS_up011373 [Pythium insidiosum]|nr:hypothetical protein PINS_up011373 [Pythium insidiosum]
MSRVLSSTLAAIALLFVSASLEQVAAQYPQAQTAGDLPIFFFHGVTSSAQAGYFLQQNLSTPTRPFVALNFCEKECSVRDLPTQVTMAIEQLKTITSNDKRFDGGYIFIGHSQGGVLARAVIEQWNEHKVHTFISLAGAQNGIFYGPQPNDRVPTQVFLKALGPKMIPKELLDFGSYSAEQVASGKMQIDFLKMLNNRTELQSRLSVANLPRSPVVMPWASTNKFLPVVNNISPDVGMAEKARRKRNFLKLQAAHFFASPADETLSPWQTAIFGMYNEVKDMATLERDFAKLRVVDMKQTLEYRADTFGLRSLDRRGGLFLHTVEGVSHSCWVANSTPFGGSQECQFQPVFEAHLYPILSANGARDNDDSDDQNPYQQHQRHPVKCRDN